MTVKIRLWGTSEEVASVAAALRFVLEDVQEGKEYPDKGNSDLVRRYLETSGTTDEKMTRLLAAASADMQKYFDGSESDLDGGA